MAKETMEQVELLRDRLKEAHDRQKSYADKRRKDLEFAVGDAVYLKMRTFRGVDKNRKLKKLKPRYMGPYIITERIGVVAYRLALAQELSSFYDVFHISVLRRVVKEPELVLPNPPADLNRNLTALSKPVKFLDRQETENQGKVIQSVKVCWERDEIREETWEPEKQMRTDYPELFTDQSEERSDGLNSGTNSFVVGENCNRPNSESSREAQPESISELNPNKILTMPHVYKRKAQIPRLDLEASSRQPLTTEVTAEDTRRVQPEPPWESSSSESRSISPSLRLRRSSRQAKPSRKVAERGNLEE